MFRTLAIIYQDRNEISLEEFILLVSSKTVVTDEYKNFFQQLNDAVVHEDLINEILSNYKIRSLSKDIALLAFEVSEGRKTKEDLLDLCSKLEADSNIIKEDFEFVCSDLEELYNDVSAQQGLRWRLNTLNKSLGSLRRGDFGFVFARPETGKTTFLASEAAYFAQQTSSPILWFNNEEEGKKVQLRIIQASLGLTREQLFSDIQRNKDEYQRLTGSRIRLHDSASIHRSTVTRMCEELQPALVIFDQLDKVKGFDGDREDLRLGAIYIWARELAKTYCPVIGVSQADGTGEGKKWLTMDNVSGAKTAKQAEADWILGIGKSNEEGMEYVRHLHLSKNKLAGDSDTDPNMRHGRMDCLILPQIGRYKDIS